MDDDRRARFEAWYGVARRVLANQRRATGRARRRLAALLADDERRRAPEPRPMESSP